MIRLRLVLDTNVIESAAIKPEGLQRTVFLVAIAKPVRLYFSENILAGFAAVLARPELKIRKGLRQKFLQLIRNHSRVIVPSTLPQVTSDQDENMFVECADAARADYLITGNQRHFPKFWKSTKTISSRKFLDLIAPHLLL